MHVMDVVTSFLTQQHVYLSWPEPFSPYRHFKELTKLAETNFPFNDYDIYMVVPQAAHSREGGAT